MADGHRTPSELVDFLINVGVEKANKKIFKYILLGIFGGAFIALGGAGNIISGSVLVKTDPGLAKLVGACVFPVGLIMVVILGSELFTSNCMLTVALVDKKITFFQLIRNWVMVYLFNFVGAILVAYITVRGHLFSEDSVNYIQSIANAKIHADAWALFIKGILCNVLVCGAVLLSFTSKDTVGKLVGAWLPIMLFVLIGYDHSIANMFYLSAAKMLGPNVTYSGFAYNLFFVTLGNILGGMIAGIPLYYCYNHNKH